MTRTLTSPVLSGLSNQTARICHLLEVDLTPTVYLTDAGIHLTWNGHQYLASQFLQFSDIQETRELLINRCTVALSGVDQSIISLLLLDTYLGRGVRIRKAVLNEDLSVVVDPCLIMDGRIDKPIISTDPESGTCVASIDVISRWSPLQRPSGRHTNDAEQQAIFPGDLGFDQVVHEDAVIIWGGAGYPSGKPRY